MLDKLNCSYAKHQGGMFVWAKIPEEIADSYELSDMILKRAHVFLTPGSIFGDAGNKYIRVSLCTAEERIEEAIKRIKNI